MTEESASPALTVVLIVGDQRIRSQSALHSILSQNIVKDIEVILFDYGVGKYPPLEGSENAAVKVVRPSAGMHYGQARAIGVKEARAPVVAFLEEHCIALNGWADALVAAHRGPWAGVGCEVHNGNPGMGRSNMIFYAVYGIFAPPAVRGETADIPGQNSAYKRDILLRYGDDLQGFLLSDAILQKMLRQDGYRLFLEPEAKIGHLNELRLMTIGMGSYLYSRLYFSMRVRYFNWSLLRRFVYIAGAVTLPVYRLLHMYRFVVKQHRERSAVYYRSIPAILVNSIYSACGIVIALIFGEGDSAMRFTCYELTAPRSINDEPFEKY